MSMSKRQQARNERALQDLIKSVPGNDRCADCAARNPGWASWSLGVFLCMRCGALHRKLGTHVSKVKSLSMDTWTSDQVEHMKQNGNILVNKKFNPRNIKPNVPLDADEVDSVMERFIRQKYQEMSLADGRPRPPSRKSTGYNVSPEGSPPPPLPPKTKGKFFGFGLRATSSAYPLSKHDRKNLGIEQGIDPPMRIASPPLPSKQSRIFGANIGNDSSMDTKLTTLRDMGFPDDARNSTMLKGLNGDLERTIESLVRLGEGSQPPSRNRTPRGSNNNTPSTSTFPDHVKSPTLKPPSASNPFDEPTNNSGFGASVSQPTVQQGLNPFGIPPDPQSLESSFNSMQISQQPQSLFPNSTGGYPIQNPPVQQMRMQQSMTPPVPTLHNPFFQPMQATANPYAAMMQSPASQMPENNPYYGQAIASNAMQSPQPLQQQQNQQSFNPFQTQFSNYQTQPNLQGQQPEPARQQTYPQPQNTNPFEFDFGGPNTSGSQDIFSNPQPTSSQYTNSQPQQQQQPQYQQQAQQQQYQQQYQIPQQPQIQQQPTNTQSSIGYFQNPYQQHQQQAAPLMPQQTGRYDKSSILALYNYPQLAPPPLPTIMDEASPSGEMPSRSFNNGPAISATPSSATPTSQPQSIQPLTQKQRSVTMPAAPSAGSRNPFLNSVSAGGNGAFGIAGHSSRESVDLAGLQTGRYSPDAFASLSARSVR